MIRFVDSAAVIGIEFEFAVDERRGISLDERHGEVVVCESQGVAVMDGHPHDAVAKVFLQFLQSHHTARTVHTPHARVLLEEQTGLYASGQFKQCSCRL